MNWHKVWAIIYPSPIDQLVDTVFGISILSIILSYIAYTIAVYGKCIQKNRQIELLLIGLFILVISIYYIVYSLRPTDIYR